MKRTSVLFIVTSILIISCQKEISMDDTSSTTDGTDTSVILTRKIIYHNVSGDSSISVYRNNMINGRKGFVVFDSSYPIMATSKSTFKYDNSNNLIAIETQDWHNGNLSNATFTINRTGNHIQNIKWVEDGRVFMDRDYYYDIRNDSLLIEYEVITKPDFAPGNLDSTSVLLLTDTGYSRIRRIFEQGVFDYTFLPGSSDKGNFFNEITFQYAGLNILSSKFEGEINFFSTNQPFNHERDSAVSYFTRSLNANPYLKKMENDFFGKEFRMLSFEQNDSINYWIDNFFKYGDYYSAITFNNHQNTYLQYGTSVISTYAPVTNAHSSYVIYRDGILVDRQTAHLYRKVTYQFDSQNRITKIDEYDAATNQLLTEIFYTYP